MIEAFAPDDPRREGFDALAPRSRTALPEPVPPHASCVLMWRGDRPVARLSMQVATDMPAVGARVGLVGHYETRDPEAGVALLRITRERLSSAGATCVLGPMNGSPWARYRLMLPEATAGPPCIDPFLGEPCNPPDYPAQFLAAGFVVAARYESRIVRDLAIDRPGATALAERLAARGYDVRPFDLGRLDAELAALYRFCAVAFAAAPYYRAIDQVTFRRLYAPLAPLMDPELVLLARDRKERLVGCLLALPDWPNAREGRPTRVVLKTLACDPEARALGLGAHLADRFHALAHRKGYSAAIHALMHEANPSVKLSRRYGSETFRRYALFRAEE